MVTHADPQYLAHGTQLGACVPTTVAPKVQVMASPGCPGSSQHILEAQVAQRAQGRQEDHSYTYVGPHEAADSLDHRLEGF